VFLWEHPGNTGFLFLSTFFSHNSEAKKKALDIMSGAAVHQEMNVHMFSACFFYVFCNINKISCSPNEKCHPIFFLLLCFLSHSFSSLFASFF
jgi:hypothetical protein